MKRTTVLSFAVLFVLFGAALSPLSSRWASPIYSPVPSSWSSLGESTRAHRDSEPITIFFVRHAETAGSTRSGGDPQLSEAGRARAASLARLLAHADVTRFFSSEYSRTRGTLAELAKKNELEVIAASKGEEQIEALRSLPPGTVAVLAGHSNTVPALIRGLGGELERMLPHERYGPMLAHHEYDRLFCVTLDPVSGRAIATIELGYGETCPAPKEAGASR